jgi:hypothetical protein
MEGFGTDSFVGVTIIAHWGNNGNANAFMRFPEYWEGQRGQVSTFDIYTSTGYSYIYLPAIDR